MPDNLDTCEDALELFGVEAARLGIDLDESQDTRFLQFCRLLRAANETMNLTALRAPSQIMSGLFLSSLAMIAALPSEYRDPTREIKLVDVGSGSGIPGVPLKILFPAWQLVAIDATRKKAGFISAVAEALELEGVTVLAERAEVVGIDEAFRDRADLCVARAVAKIPTLIELCAPLTAPGGLMAFAKGQDIDAEVQSAAAAARALNATLEKVVSLSPLPPSTASGTVVLYRKCAATPPGYPRRVGLATSRPLGG